MKLQNETSKLKKFQSNPVVNNGIFFKFKTKFDLIHLSDEKLD